MAQKIFGDLELFTQSELRLRDADSSNYAALKAPATISTNFTLTLPDTDGDADQVLKSDGSGVLSWSDFLSGTLAQGAVYIGNSSGSAAAYDSDLVGDVKASIQSFDFVDGDVSVAANTITETSHGLANGQIVYLTNSGGGLPTGLSADTAYFVLEDTANTFKLASSYNGTEIDITAASGGGTHTLNFGGLEHKGIVDENIRSNAGITLSKLAALTASRALVSDGSGVVSASSVTSTELGHVSGVTSAIQTQLDGKASTALDNLASVAINTSLISDTNNTDDLGSSAIGWANGYINILHMDSNSQTTAIQGSASASASVTYSLPPADGTSGFVLSTNGSGVLSWVSNASSSTSQADWITADGTTKAVTHSLGTKDVMVQIYDKTNDQTIQVDSVIRTDTNTVTLTSSEAPGASGWRVLVIDVS